jgi:hypothetical protein
MNNFSLRKWQEAGALLDDQFLLGIYSHQLIDLRDGAASVGQMDYVERYADTPLLAALFLPGIDKDYIIR